MPSVTGESGDTCRGAFSFVQCTSRLFTASSSSTVLFSAPKVPMARPASRPAASNELVDLARDAVAALDALLAEAAQKVRERVVVEGHAVSRLLDREQRATHGLSWLGTYVEAVRQLAAYAERMTRDGTFGEIEDLIVRIGLGEYLAQIAGGIPMSQSEIVRLSDLGLSTQQVATRLGGAIDALISGGNTALRRARLVELM